MLENKKDVSKKRKTFKWIVLLTLLIISGVWFLSFYVRLTPAGKGVASDPNTPTVLNGVEFTHDN